MKYQVYVKKEIKSEADLPTEEKIYFSHHKKADRDEANLFFKEYDTEYWLDHIDWYLQPIELDLPDDAGIDEMAIRSYSDSVHGWIFGLGIKWLRNKIENQLK